MQECFAAVNVDVMQLFSLVRPFGWAMRSRQYVKSGAATQEAGLIALLFRAAAATHVPLEIASMLLNVMPASTESTRQSGP